MPPFASVLLFEFHEDGDKQWIEVFYNKEKFNFPTCTDADKCTLKEFHDFLDTRGAIRSVETLKKFCDQ
jgi:hypothetical protein